MKKILHISKYYPPYWGGIEDVCHTNVKIIQNHSSHQQKIICFNTTSKTVTEEYDGVEVIRVATITKVANQAIPIGYRLKLRELFRDYKPDIIHFHHPNPLVAKYLLSTIPSQTRLIIHWHSDIVAQKHLYKLVKRTEDKLLNRADTIIATSPNYIEKSKPLTKYKNKTIVIQNTIHSEKFIRTQEINKLIEAVNTEYNDTPLILFVGRHVPYKGLEYLLAASELLEEPHRLVIAGEGVLTKKLKSRYQANHNIQFIGKIPESLLVAYYHAAHIFAFPSITKNEAFGVAIAEAMYCSTPVVTFTIEGSGVNWVNLHEETGLEVENKNVELLAKAIDSLLRSKDLAEKYGTNAKKRTDQLFIEEVIEDKILNLYR